MFPVIHWLGIGSICAIFIKCLLSAAHASQLEISPLRYKLFLNMMVSRGLWLYVQCAKAVWTKSKVHLCFFFKQEMPVMRNLSVNMSEEIKCF